MGTKDDITLYMHALGFVAEVPFKGLTGKRKWRWDWAKGTVAVEYHGIGVGHQSVKGTWRDHEKTTEGQLCGFTVIQCNAGSVKDGRCFDWIERAVGGHPPKRRGAGQLSEGDAAADGGEVLGRVPRNRRSKAGQADAQPQPSRAPAKRSRSKPRA